jgi:hypothetical protein
MEVLTAISPADRVQRPPSPARAASISPYDAVRTVLGIALLAAAWLKAHWLTFTGVGGVGIFASSWFQLTNFEVESAAGLWLLAGFAPRVTRWAALSYFALLGCVAAYHGMSGDSVLDRFQ